MNSNRYTHVNFQRLIKPTQCTRIFLHKKYKLKYTTTTTAQQHNYLVRIGAAFKGVRWVEERVIQGIVGLLGILQHASGDHRRLAIVRVATNEQLRRGRFLRARSCIKKCEIYQIVFIL